MRMTVLSSSRMRLLLIIIVFYFQPGCIGVQALMPIASPFQQARKQATAMFRSGPLEDQPQEEKTPYPAISSRRKVFQRLLVSTASILSAIPPPAHARGLIMFPCVKPLFNTYHFMAAGISILTQENNIWSTNPLFLTNREDALHPSVGEAQVQAACQTLRMGAPTIIKYSLAASCIDTSNIIGRELKLGRDRIIPEFTFMDPRAIGLWDNMDAQTTKPAIWAMDNDEAGPGGVAGRPPPNEDGTPNETLADQAIRLRQLLSVLETQYSGDTILLVFPDTTGPALLSAMIAGIPYNRVHELEYQPGEVRLDVTRESTLKFWKERKDTAVYLDTIRRGRENLEKLRAAGEDVTSLKDQIVEAERIKIDKAFAEENEKKRRAEREEQDRKLRERQEELEALKLTGSGSNSLTHIGVSAAVVGGTVAVSMGSSSDRSSEDKISETDDDAPHGNPLEIKRPTTEPALAESIVATAAVSETATNTTEPSARSTPRTNKPADPIEAAEEAMQNYLDQDDGTEAWLQSVAEISRDDDDLGDNVFQ